MAHGQGMQVLCKWQNVISIVNKGAPNKFFSEVFLQNLQTFKILGKYLSRSLDFDAHDDISASIVQNHICKVAVRQASS